MLNLQAQKAIDIAKVAAGGAALSPIPFSDLAALGPICVTEIVGIYQAYHYPIEPDDVKAIIHGALDGLHLSLNAHGIQMFALNHVAGNLLKLVPVIGTATGALIDGASAIHLVEMIGTNVAQGLANDEIQDSFDLSYVLIQTIAAQTK